MSGKRTFRELDSPLASGLLRPSSAQELRIRNKITQSMQRALIKPISLRCKKKYKKDDYHFIISTFLSTNSLMIEFIAIIGDRLREAEITPDSRDHLLSTFINGRRDEREALSCGFDFFFPELTGAMTTIVAEGENIQAINAQLLSLSISEVESQASLVWLDDKIMKTEEASAPEDIREHHTDEILQRRFDSLARLLSLNARYSVCSAVTIEGDEVIIGANLSGKENAHCVAELLRQKFFIIREFLNDCMTLEMHIHHPDMPNLIQNYIRRLMVAGGTAQNDALLTQALYKLFVTISTYHLTSAQEKALLSTDHCIILLPNGKQKETSNDVNTLSSFIGGQLYLTPEHTIPFDEELQSTVVKHFHAEQLIAFYLMQVKSLSLVEGLEEKRRVGVSKLCCKTCALAFEKLYLFQIRGTHGVSYEGTINLFSNSKCSLAKRPKNEFGSPIVEKKVGPTGAHPSPFESPFTIFATTNRSNSSDAMPIQVEENALDFSSDDSDDALPTCSQT